ncbi:MAG: hypothetical protein HYZ42_04410, partial [Bacteroidetes bacterium]|nr:hypothetical protein [Bacteroidota bacterium]
MAYEFTHIDTQISKRANLEKVSFNKLKSGFQNHLNTSEEHLTEYLSNWHKKYTEYSEAIDIFKKEKEQNFAKWFNESKNSFENFKLESYNALQDLEELYKEKLKLEEPAQYWKTRSIKMNQKGLKAMWIMIILILLVAIPIILMLWHVPDQLYASFIAEDKSAAIRWSILYITFISFLAIG